VIAAGHTRLVALVAGFPGFHTSGDDGRAVDPQKLAGVAAGLTSMLRNL
jgi:hypothetical protein